MLKLYGEVGLLVCVQHAGSLCLQSVFSNQLGPVHVYTQALATCLIDAEHSMY